MHGLQSHTHAHRHYTVASCHHKKKKKRKRKKTDIHFFKWSLLESHQTFGLKKNTAQVFHIYMVNHPFRNGRSSRLHLFNMHRWSLKARWPRRALFFCHLNSSVLLSGCKKRTKIKPSPFAAHREKVIRRPQYLEGSPAAWILLLTVLLEALKEHTCL